MRLLHTTSILSSVSLALAWTTYVVPHSGGNDDTPALAAALSADPKLATNATILFEQGLTYNILTPIVFPRFENVIVSVQGNLSYATDIKATQGANPPELRDASFNTDAWRWFLLEIVGSAVGHVASPKVSAYPEFFFTEFHGTLVGSRPFFPNGSFTLTFLRFMFKGGSNVTLEGSKDPCSGWVDSHGQQVREKLLVTGGCMLIKLYQWWDVMQELESQVNRPNGWGLQKITNGEIKYMKLWQVSVGVARPVQRSDLTPMSPSP